MGAQDKQLTLAWLTGSGNQLASDQEQPAAPNWTTDRVWDASDKATQLLAQRLGQQLERTACATT
jgi:hypothetical protein